MSLEKTLQLEKEALSMVCFDLKVNNTEMCASKVSKIKQLQKDLTAENEIMDKLVQKTEKAKVLFVNLNYTTTHLDDLDSDKTIFRSYILDINQYLQRLMETHDSILTISVRQHFSDKLKPVFTLVNQLECVLGCRVIPKTGREQFIQEKIQKEQPQLKPKSNEQHEQKPKVDQNGNEASGSKGKENIVDDFEEEEEEEEISEGEKLIRKNQDKELDEIMRVIKEEEAKEREPHEAKATLESQKTLFLPWSMERILNEAVNNLSTHKLEPVFSFELDNT